MEIDDSAEPALRLALAPIRERVGVRYQQMFALLMVVASGIGAMRMARDFGLSWGWAVGALLLGAVVGWVVARRIRQDWTACPHPQPVTIWPDRFELPLPSSPEETVTIRPEEITALGLLSGPRGLRLYISTADGLLMYPQAAFVESHALDTLRVLLERAISRGSDGSARQALLTRRAALFRVYRGRRANVTGFLLALIVAMYIVQDHLGARGEDPLRVWMVLLEMGAHAPRLVEEGQWWRLLTACFLHGPLIHIGMNGLALLSLGNVLERLLGAWRFLLVYLVSAAVGSLASFWWSGVFLSVGASGAIFGLLGGFAWMSWRFPDDLPPGLRQSRRWWWFVFIVNAALPVILPVIDGAAHGGGFIAGAAMTALCLGPAKDAPWSRPAGYGVRGLAAAAALTVVVAGALQVSVGRADVSTDTIRRMIAKTEDMPATFANAQAWGLVTRAETSQAGLNVALDFAERAHEQAPDDSDILDTLAAVQFRLGSYEEAVLNQRRALGRRPKESGLGRRLVEVWDAFFRDEVELGTDALRAQGDQWNRMGRFLTAWRAERDDDPRMGFDGPIEAIHMHREADALVVDLTDTSSTALEIMAQVTDTRRIGIVVVHLPPSSSASHRFDLDAIVTDIWPSSAELDILWIHDAKGEDASWRFHMFDEKKDELPELTKTPP